MSKKTSKREHLLLPWYLNDTLTGEEKKAVDTQLRQEPNSQRELEAWRNIQRVLSNQPQQTPPFTYGMRLVDVYRKRGTLDMLLGISGRWLVLWLAWP